MNKLYSPTIAPGWELDVLIAEKVMGWKLVCYGSDVAASEPGQYHDASKNDGWMWDGDKKNREAHEFQPTTDVATAFEVVESLWGKKEINTRLEFVQGTPKVFMWHYTAKQSVSAYSYGDTPAHALCLAALKAIV